MRATSLRKFIAIVFVVFAASSIADAQARPTRTPTPTPTPIPTITIDFTAVKQNVVDQGAYLVREIDLKIEPKAKDKSCDQRVLKNREKALALVDDLNIAVGLLPDTHRQGSTDGLYCVQERVSSSVSVAKRKFSDIVRSIATLARLEKTCKAKYGLSYAPDYTRVNQVNKDFTRFPRIATICF